MSSEKTLSRPKIQSLSPRRPTPTPAHYTSSNNERGSGIVEVLIAIGLMGVLMTGMISSLEFQNKQMKALSEKLAISDFGNTLAATMMDGSACQYALNPPSGQPLTFNANKVSPTSPQKISLSKLYASVSPTGVVGPVLAQVGEAPSAYSNSVSVKSIELAIDSAPSPLPPPQPGVTFKGTWLVEFDSAKLTRPLKPAMASVILTVDTTNPTAAKITECQSATPGTGSTSMYLYGVAQPGPFPLVGPNCQQVKDCPTGWTEVGVGPTGVPAANCKTLLGATVPQVIRTCITNKSHSVIYLHGTFGGLRIFGGRAGNCLDADSCPPGWTDAGMGQSGPPSDVCLPRIPYRYAETVTRTCYR